MGKYYENEMSYDIYLLNDNGDYFEDEINMLSAHGVEFRHEKIKSSIQRIFVNANSLNENVSDAVVSDVCYFPSPSDMKKIVGKSPYE